MIVLLIAVVTMFTGIAVRGDAVAVEAQVPTTQPADAFMRGITISCFRHGPGEWDSPQMDESLGDIQRLGAGWMAFHPYGRIGDDGTVRHRGTVDDASVLTPIAMAHARGMKVMLIPHIAYWRSGFSWRGDIHFDDESQWQHFFAQYADFIITQAQMAEAANVELFVIGVEMKRTLHREADWRTLIEKVRAVYSGKLTYAANWDAYTKVPFWDALDVIGVQAYFPLTDAEKPDEAALRQSWDKLLGELDAFAQRAGKPMIFTELGYNASEHAAREPWESRVVGDDGDALKLLCMRIALERIEASGVIDGVFLWKWFPSQRQMRHNFMLQYDEMQRVIGEAWVTTIVRRDDQAPTEVTVTD